MSFALLRRLLMYRLFGSLSRSDVEFSRDRGQFGFFRNFSFHFFFFLFFPCLSLSFSPSSPPFDRAIPLDHRQQSRRLPGTSYPENYCSIPRSCSIACFLTLSFFIFCPFFF